ncbi:4-coumarate-CoA ligase [Exophiala viscosa]|uniref:4-coumarate-CoA ligase n=1 Tax=Exophiala viscosa TaxID=2486360 RepID=A0AAN6IEP9_9EURO|nr:4-coumarate-CoA ligase [Exophiala viscosa]KAI1624310.1 4-coumarate-CoA ligase [Exophiala viscosa]
MSFSPPRSEDHVNQQAHQYVRTATKSLVIPPADIFTFAFANLGQYDKNKPIFVHPRNDESESISASQAYLVVCQLIEGLKELGVKEGDCVILHSYNNIWYPLVYLAIVGSGACVSGVNPAYTSSELERHFKLTKPKLIFTQTRCIKPVLEAASICDISKSDVFLIGGEGDAPIEGCRNWRSLLVDSVEHPFNHHPQSGGSLAAYATTSGTTGLPKVAMIPHRYIVAQAAILEDQYNARPYQPSQLICLPVFHAFASPLALVLPLRLGIPTYFLPKFHLPDFLHAVNKFGITDAPIVPPIAGILAQLGGLDAHSIRFLRYVICAGAVLNPVVQATLIKRLRPGAVVAQCWGTTEAGWHTLHGWSEKNDTGTVGRLLPNMEMKLIGANGDIVKEHNKVGEALIRSPTMFLSYLPKGKANRDSFDSDGFYRTGDLVLIRDDNKVVHAGRCKEILKVNGWQVSPTEVESVLESHPLIADAAVYGVSCEDPNGTYQTILCAYVVQGFPEGRFTQAAMNLSEDDIKAFVASKLISYKHLKEVKFVKAIPRALTGKILRTRLGIVEEAE